MAAFFYITCQNISFSTKLITDILIRHSKIVITHPVGVSVHIRKNQNDVRPALCKSGSNIDSSAILPRFAPTEGILALAP